jgi:hypothetical protein
MTAVVELRSRLESLNVKLSTSRRKLIVDAPAGALTPDIRAALVEHKEAILDAMAFEELPEPWPPRPTDLRTWPVERRQRWGELANMLEDAGIPWPEHERQAFERTKSEM